MNTDEVLRYAYRAETIEIQPQSMYRELAGRSTSPSVLTPEEVMADGVMILARARREISAMEALVLDIYYRLPVSKDLDRAVEHAIELVAEAIIKLKRQRVDRYFVRDAIRRWSPNGQPHHTLKWWAQHLQRSSSTVYFWATDKNPSNKSVRYVLDYVYDSAMYTLEPILTGILDENMV